MKNNNFVNHSYKGVRVEMRAQKNINNQVIRGKMMYCPVDNLMLVLQNPPRGPRSVEIMRTPHARMVRRHNGKYTLTFRFTAEEFCIAEQLLLEMRAIVTNPLLNLKHRAA